MAIMKAKELYPLLADKLNKLREEQGVDAALEACRSLGMDSGFPTMPKMKFEHNKEPRMLSHDALKSMAEEHFDLESQMTKIIWPSYIKFDKFGNLYVDQHEKDRVTGKVAHETDAQRISKITALMCR